MAERKLFTLMVQYPLYCENYLILQLRFDFVTIITHQDEFVVNCHEF